MSIDKLTDKLAEIASAIQGPGFEAAKGAASVAAISTLVSGVVCGALAVAAAYASRWAWKRYDARERGNYDAEFGYTLLFILFGLAAIPLGIRAVWAFADPWTWTALTQPELWLAKRALGL